MELKIKRSQSSKGIMGKTVTFVIQARANLTNEEQANIKKYGLGKEVMYNSEKAQEHLARGRAKADHGSYVGALASLARASLSLRITIDNLMQGVQVECNGLEEAITAEEAVISACNDLAAYIKVAAQYDGTEHTIEINPDLG